MSLSKVIKTAELELGVTEWPRGSNKVKYNTAYYGKEVSGKNYPWCVTFPWWVFQEAGERMAFFGGGKTARCTVLLEWYEKQGLTVPVSEVKRGDIALLNFNGKSTADHCGLVTGAGLKDGIFVVTTIEGNTSPGLEGSQDNGGSVAKKERNIRQIVAVCRPQYKEEEMPKDDITGHWAEQEIRRCMKRGIIKGYPDGSFAPDKPITRAELAVILDRLLAQESPVSASTSDCKNG